MSKFPLGSAPDSSILPPGDHPLVTATTDTFPNAASLYDLPAGFFCLRLPPPADGLLQWTRLLAAATSPDRVATCTAEPLCSHSPEVLPEVHFQCDSDFSWQSRSSPRICHTTSLLTPDDELWSPLLASPQTTSWRRPQQERHPAHFGNITYHRPSPERNDADPSLRRQPPRAARPSIGDTSSLNLVSDTVSAGKLPPTYMAPRPEDYHSIFRKEGDLELTWIDQSFFCPGAGTGFFFELRKRVPAGYLIGTYFGPNSRALNLLYQDALRLWADSDFVLADSTVKYVVAGSPYCGPAYSNDGFSICNCVFLYNRTLNRMEIRTRGPMDAGKYEALVNYDIPNQLPSYWNLARQRLLPVEARAACVFYYQSNSSRPPVSSTRYAKARQAVAKSKSTKASTTDLSTPRDTKRAGSPAPSSSNAAPSSGRSIRSWFSPSKPDEDDNI